jgi:kynurenine 3-monooxygenase
MQQKNITIIGAGLVGSLLSIYLAKRGHKIKLFERRGDMRKEKIAAGRSINLALSDRGLRALELIGIADDIKKIAIPMHGRSIHNADNSTAFQPYGKEGQFINSVSRGTLNCMLMDLAEENGVEIFFNHKCANIDWHGNTVNFELDEKINDQHSIDNIQHQVPNNKTPNTKHKTIDFDLLFGADGAYSAARLQHQLQHQKFDYNQFYIDCGYKELTIPAGENGTFLIEKNALHIWPRKEFMLIALPNLDGSFTCTLFFPFEGELSFSKLDTEEKVKTFFEKTFPDAIKLMPDYVHEFLHNPTSSLVTVKCFPWVRENKFALIGDAAHAIVPFFGQGMNCGFEDCIVLDELMENFGDDWNKILAAFQYRRKPDADAIAELALNNFIEMREKVADAKFLLQKKIERKLNEKYPGKWIPAYTQVTFSPQIRYSEALRNSEKQEKIMAEIMQIENIENIWESEEVEKKILQKLADK